MGRNVELSDKFVHSMLRKLGLRRTPEERDNKAVAITVKVDEAEDTQPPSNVPRSKPISIGKKRQEVEEPMKKYALFIERCVYLANRPTLKEAFARNIKREITRVERERKIEKEKKALAKALDISCASWPHESPMVVWMEANSLDVPDITRPNQSPLVVWNEGNWLDWQQRTPERKEKTRRRGDVDHAPRSASLPPRANASSPIDIPRRRPPPKEYCMYSSRPAWSPKRTWRQLLQADESFLQSLHEVQEVEYVDMIWTEADVPEVQLHARILEDQEYPDLGLYSDSESSDLEDEPGADRKEESLEEFYEWRSEKSASDIGF